MHREGSDQQRISIVLPPELAAAQPTASTSSTFTDAIPSEYTLTINNAASRNMFVFGENENAGPPSRKRQSAPPAHPLSLLTCSDRCTGDPFIAGTIKHECSVMPKLGAEYTKIVRERQLQADQPKRRCVSPLTRSVSVWSKPRAVMLDSDSASFNRMASGVSSLQNASKFKGFVVRGCGLL